MIQIPLSLGWEVTQPHLLLFLRMIVPQETRSLYTLNTLLFEVLFNEF